MRLIACLAFPLALFLPLAAAPRHTHLLREAAGAAQASDHATAVNKLEEAARLRPDYVRIQLNLARLYAALARPDDALAALGRVAAMGLQLNFAADAGLAPLRDLPRFQALAAAAAAGPAPVGVPAETACSVRDATGIIESCLYDPVTAHWFFGDVRERCVWRLDPDTGGVERFTSEADALDGVFKLALSPDRQTVWAATNAVGVMTGPAAVDGERAALVALDARTGRVRARYPVPADGRKHLLGDFLVAPDGSILATDSYSPVIWRLPAGGTAFAPWLEHDDFLSLQGIALSPDAATLYVSDYANGIWRIDVATRSPELLIAPANATFFGLDGLYAIPGGLLAVQNGVNPQRLLRIEPAAAGASPTRVLASGGPGLTDLALGQVIADRFCFIGNSGWALYDPPPATTPPPRAVAVLRVPLE